MSVEEYYKYGEKFCREIENELGKQKIKCAFVPGGGFVYRSIKYKENTIGDYDFMIIYVEQSEITKIINGLGNSAFEFSKKYVPLQMELLNDSKIDILRISGSYRGIKATINLVPIRLVKDIIELNKDIIIKKISHQRNTGIFNSRGTNGKQILVCFLSQNFVYDDGTDHYIHLDYSMTSIDKESLYFGILSDAILKGYIKGYDRIGFQRLRQKYISNIANFFKNNNISMNNYMNIFSNNEYFSENIKEMIIKEFNNHYNGEINKEQIQIAKYKGLYERIIIIKEYVAVGYPTSKFSFVNFENKKNCNFLEYIKEKQGNAYGRLYIYDAFVKLLSNIIGFGIKKCEGDYKPDVNILRQIEVYRENELYVKDISEENIMYRIIDLYSLLLYNKDELNPDVADILLEILIKFIEKEFESDDILFIKDKINAIQKSNKL